MDNVFLVTSGLNVESGQIAPELRLKQTIETAESIKRHAPNSYMVLLEGGRYPLTLDQRGRLLEVYDDVIDFTSHPTIVFAHSQNVNAMYIKGPCESLMLHEACKLIPRDVHRVFKISGRYLLSEEFNIENHDVRGKYLFKNKDTGVRYYHDGKNDDGSQLQNIEQYFTEYQYKTRLYSFCGSLLDKATDNYNNIFQCMIQSYINHGYIDLEHSTYRVLDQDDVSETPVIGVQGIQAENSIFLKE